MTPPSPATRDIAGLTANHAGAGYTLRCAVPDPRAHDPRQCNGAHACHERALQTHLAELSPASRAPLLSQAEPHSARAFTVRQKTSHFLSGTSIAHVGRLDNNCTTSLSVVGHRRAGLRCGIRRISHSSAPWSAHRRLQAGVGVVGLAPHNGPPHRSSQPEMSPRCPPPPVHSLFGCWSGCGATGHVMNRAERAGAGAVKGLKTAAGGKLGAACGRKESKKGFTWNSLQPREFSTPEPSTRAFPPPVPCWNVARCHACSSEAMQMACCSRLRGRALTELQWPFR